MDGIVRKFMARVRVTALSTGLVMVGMSFLLVSEVQADPVQFIRGDANSDGRVSISDSGFLMGYLFLGSPGPECMSSGDANDDGQLDLSDEVFILRHLFLDGAPIPPPFPDPSLDPTPDTTTCESYGNGTPLEDVTARIAILDASAPGGDDRTATLPIAFSSSTAIAGYSLVLPDGGVLDLGPESDQPGLRDLSPFLAKHNGGFLGGSAMGEGRFEMGTLFALTQPKEVPPSEDVVLLEIVVCLKPGTPAGAYPLALEAGELVAGCGTECPDTGRAIPPALVGGTLTVEADVLLGASCETFVPPPPPPPPPIYILFKLEDKTAAAGGDVTVPFIVKADRESTGFSYSVHFDEALLQCTGTDQLWIKPDGTPYEFVKYEWNNETGFAVGAAIISLSDTGEVLPPNVETRVLEIDFHVGEDAPEGATMLEFRDGGRASGGSVRNKLIAGGQEITPGLASSFVFVDGRINIVPDGSPFVRGDSNDDEAINISDPQFTLNSLFLGGPAPRCEDAADSNDDGKIDISDAVAALQFLFLGGTRLPPPFPRPGLDPTGDKLHCPGR